MNVAQITKILKEHILGIAFLAVVTGVVGNLVYDNIKTHLSASPASRPIPETWQVASLVNKTDRNVSFSVFHPETNIWGITSVKSQSVKVFVAKNHPINLMVLGQSIYLKQPTKRFTHTYKGKECYILEGTIFNHPPSESEQLGVKPNQFLEMISGNPLPFGNAKTIYFGILGPTGSGLKTFIPEDFAISDKLLSVTEDPDAEVWVQDEQHKLTKP